jgi:cation diffusion facilitator CzcD-associated flavoprotein CzcO
VPDSPSADEIRRFPYLGDGFQLLPREAAPVETAHALSRIHLFNWGSAISHGAVAGDIPGVAIGANRLANALVRDLFVEDAARHEPRMRAHDEAELKPTRWWVPPEVSRG